MLACVRVNKIDPPAEDVTGRSASSQKSSVLRKRAKVKGDVEAKMLYAT